MRRKHFTSPLAITPVLLSLAFFALPALAFVLPLITHAQTLPSTVFYPVSVNPPQGNGPSNTFKVGYYDQNGASSIAQAYVFFTPKTSSSEAGTCLIEYDQKSNSLFLMNDAGSTWSAPAVVGVAGTLSNTQCTVNVGNSSVSVIDSTHLVLTLPITFSSSFYGSNSIEGAVVDNGTSSGWIGIGRWTGAATSTPGELIDTLSYFVTQHPTVALRLASWPDGNAFFNQIVDAAYNRLFFTKWGPRSFIGYTWDSNYIYFLEDDESDFTGSSPPSEAFYSFSPGYWMEQEMHVGDAIDGTATRNVQTMITYMNSSCQVTSTQRYGMKTVLESHNPSYDLGGDLGVQDVIILRIEESTYSEKEFYAKGWGLVGWEQCSLDGTICDTSAASGSGFWNTFDSLPARAIDNSDACLTQFKGPATTTAPISTPAPTVTLTASPTSITSGQSSSLSWSSMNASSCSGTKFSPNGTSGSAAVSPTATTTYALTCTGSGGSASTSTTVSVSPAPAPSPPTFGKGVMVATIAKLNVRNDANIWGKILCVQPVGSTGIITGSPISAQGYIWWDVDYTKGCDGWSIQTYLTTSVAVLNNESQVAGAADSLPALQAIKSELQSLLQEVESIIANAQGAM
jgi:hypothetical protein